MGPSPSIRVALVAVVVAAIEVGGTFGASAGQDRHPLTVAAVGLVLVGPASLLLWRRPLAMLTLATASVATYIGLGYAYGPVFLGLVVSFALAVQVAPRAHVILAATLTYVALLVAIDADSYGNGLGWFHAVVIATWIIVVIAVAEIVRVRRAELVRRRDEQLDAERRRLDQQRVEIAQDLHDVLAHHLSLINVQASVALHLSSERPEQAAAALDTIKAASADALRELRTALDLLRGTESAPRSPTAGLSDLPALVERVRNGGLDVGLHVEAVGEPPAAVQHAVYRIVQEALTNVTRHAGATHVQVTITAADELTVTVVDDGHGGADDDPAAGGRAGGRGITGMRDRVATLGGTLDVGPAPGGGYRIVARLPVAVTT